MEQNYKSVITDDREDVENVFSDRVGNVKAEDETDNNSLNDLNNDEGNLSCKYDTDTENRNDFKEQSAMLKTSRKTNSDVKDQETKTSSMDFCTNTGNKGVKSVVHGGDEASTVQNVHHVQEDETSVTEWTRLRRKQSKTETHKTDLVTENKLTDSSPTAYEINVSKTTQKLTAWESNYFTLNNDNIKQIGNLDNTEIIHHELNLLSENMLATKNNSLGGWSEMSVKLNIQGSDDSQKELKPVFDPRNHLETDHVNQNGQRTYMSTSSIFPPTTAEISNSRSISNTYNKHHFGRPMYFEQHDVKILNNSRLEYEPSSLVSRVNNHQNISEDQKTNEIVQSVETKDIETSEDLKTLVDHKETDLKAVTEQHVSSPNFDLDSVTDNGKGICTDIDSKTSFLDSKAAMGTKLNSLCLETAHAIDVKPVAMFKTGAEIRRTQSVKAYGNEKQPEWLQMKLRRVGGYKPSPLTNKADKKTKPDTIDVMPGDSKSVPHKTSSSTYDEACLSKTPIKKQTVRMPPSSLALTDSTTSPIIHMDRGSTKLTSAVSERAKLFQLNETLSTSVKLSPVEVIAKAINLSRTASLRTLSPSRLSIVQRSQSFETNTSGHCEEDITPELLPNISQNQVPVQKTDLSLSCKVVKHWDPTAPSETKTDYSNMQDEEELKKLLSTSENFEERRMIRARIKEIRDHCTMHEDPKHLEVSEEKFMQTDIRTQNQLGQADQQGQKEGKPSKTNQVKHMDAINNSSPTTNPLLAFTYAKKAATTLMQNTVENKQLILAFCKANTAEYETIDIQNFSSSWTDGIAFCALIHHFYPEAFDFKSLNPKERRKNFELAFNTAEKYAKIAPLLEVEDMMRMEKPDWRCVFTYIQSFYRKFRDHDNNKAKDAE